MESGLNKGVLINTALFDDKVGCYKIVNDARKVRKTAHILKGIIKIQLHLLQDPELENISRQLANVHGFRTNILTDQKVFEQCVDDIIKDYENPLKECTYKIKELLVKGKVEARFSGHRFSGKPRFT